MTRPSARKGANERLTLQLAPILFREGPSGRNAHAANRALWVSFFLALRLLAAGSIPTLFFPPFFDR